MFCHSSSARWVPPTDWGRIQNPFSCSEDLSESSKGIAISSPRSAMMCPHPMACALWCPAQLHRCYHAPGGVECSSCPQTRSIFFCACVLTPWAPWLLCNGFCLRKKERFFGAKQANGSNLYSNDRNGRNELRNPTESIFLSKPVSQPE